MTILEALPKILPGLDNDVANVVVRAFKKKGIEIRTNVQVEGHTPDGDGGTTVHAGGDVDADAVIISVGRRPFPISSGSSAPPCARATVDTSKSMNSCGPVRRGCGRSAI